MDKNKLRKEIHEKRNQLTEFEVEKASKVIIKNLLNKSEFWSAKVILSYMPYGKEVDVTFINQWILDQEKVLCVPRVKNATIMEAVAVSSLVDEMTKSSFGIYEPSVHKEAFDINKIDLILVPGVAFDISGNRMGHGRGYYDRFLAQCPEHTAFWGIAYSFQVLESIPFDQYDIKVHKIITD